MSDYKEIWSDLFESFEELHGREPSVDEMRSEWASYCEGLARCWE